MNDRVRELDDTQCTAAVAADFRRDPKDLLQEIYKEATNGTQDPDARISKTLAKASTLFARLSADQERVHLSIRRLTIWLVVLTFVLTIITGLLGYDAYLKIWRHHSDESSIVVRP